VRKIRIYLAIPYSGLRDLAFKISNEVAADLMNRGFIVFSPITHSHNLSLQEELPHTWEFWKSQDEAFVEWADEVHVVVIGETGYELIDKSVGVKAEIEMAKEMGKPVIYIPYNGKYLTNV